MQWSSSTSVQCLNACMVLNFCINFNQDLFFIFHFKADLSLVYDINRQEPLASYGVSNGDIQGSNPPSPNY